MTARDAVYAELESLSPGARRKLLRDIWEDFYEQEHTLMTWVRCRFVAADEKEADGVRAFEASHPDDGDFEA